MPVETRLQLVLAVLTGDGSQRRPLAGSRVLTGEQSQPDESLESVGENI